jgi:hypothetical protein
MKCRTWTLFLFSIFSVCAHAQTQEKRERLGLQLVGTDYASMQARLVLQTGFNFYPNQVEGKLNSFTLTRARIGLSGHFVSRDLTYEFLGDAMSGTIQFQPGSPGSETYQEGQTSIPFLLDGKITWSVPSLGVALSIGRFVPEWGLLMGEKASNLGALSYPLYTNSPKNSMGVFRNLGVDLEVEVHPILILGGTIFNGGKNSWLDDNDQKDVLLYFKIDPLIGLKIRPSIIFSFPTTVDGIREDLSLIEMGNEVHIAPILEARYQDYGFDAMVGVAGNFVIRDGEDTRTNYQSLGLLGHLGYFLIGDWFQLMARVEWWEPSTRAGKDEQFRITVGPQTHVDKIHAQFFINYVYDYFMSDDAMCANYLQESDCGTPREVPQVRRGANTIFFSFLLDI